MKEYPWYKNYPKEVPYNIDYPEEPLFWLLERAYKKFPANTSLVFYNKKMTYEEFYKSSIMLAGFLQKKLGVKKGDRIAFLMPNCTAYPIAYYAVAKIGGIIAQFNPLYTERELELLIKDAQAQVAITIDALAYKFNDMVRDGLINKLIVARMKDMLPFPLNLLYPLKARKIPKPQFPLGFEVIDFFKAIKDGCEPDSVDINPKDDVVVFQYTGGTTGLAKAAMLTHYNLISNTLQVASWTYRSKPGEEVMMCVLPFFHSYGMTVAMNTGIFLGAKLIMEPRFEVERVVKLIEKYRVTKFPGVPTMYVAVNKYASEHKVDLSSIESCISGAAPLPVEVAEEFERLTGGRLIEGYGLSEASPVTHANPVYGKRKFGSIGLPLPDTLAKIIDVETGEDLPIGEVGELCIKGPQVMKGYWNRPEETEAVLTKDGWLRTGDIAKMDEEGYFYIVDRKKDMIISGGYNIYPREVEEVLYQHPKILEAAVIGVPDEYKGEVVKAFVVLKPGMEATEEEIISFCKEKLAPYKVPKKVEFMKELPKSAVGKILRRLLKEREGLS